MNKPPPIPPPLPPVPPLPPAPPRLGGGLQAGRVGPVRAVQPRKRYSMGRQLARAFVWAALLGVVLFRVFVFKPEPSGPRGPWGQGERRQFGQERRGSWRVPVAGPESPLPTNLWRIELELTTKAENALRRHQQHFRGRGELEVTERPEVTLTVKEGGRVYTNVAAHLKGAAGSFRPYDDTPAFTLNFSKHAKGQRFHGYSKISLNNSVQDPTLIHEMLSRELFVAAGVPAPRAHHATVVVNGRDLGVYVVVEGWGKPFLKQHFEEVGGNLYDGGFVQDIDGSLTVVSGDDEESHPGLKRLVNAVRGANRTNGWDRLSGVLDVERFATLLAMDTLICNWDGYAMNRNNWRVFHDRKADRMVFMPHGLDQVFGQGRRMGVDSSIEPGARGHVARLFLSTPQGRKRYLERLGELRTNVLDPDRVAARIDEIAGTIRPTLKAYSAGAAHRHELMVRDLVDRVRRRAENVSEQLARPNGMPTFDSEGLARITRWRGAQSQEMVGRAEFEGAVGERLPGLRLRGEAARGSWRSRVRLETGGYRLEGRARLREPGQAMAGLRISGEVAGLEGLKVGEWTALSYGFIVEDPLVEVDLVLDVVGTDVVVEMDPGSFRLVRTP